MLRWLLIACCCLLAPNSSGAESFRSADGPREWSFPRDHGSHPGFATEWWYFTGSLIDTDNHHFGFELTFFRVGLRPDLPASSSQWRARDLVLAHFAVTEVEWERFHLRERLGRASGSMAVTDSTRLNVSIADWSATALDDQRFHLLASEDGLGLDLTLTIEKPPVLHGDRGLSPKSHDGSEASYYYSLPRLRTSGVLTIDEHSRPVRGMTWMDHEFFSGDTPREGLGWDWFSVRLVDGRDLMLYRIRREGSGAAFGTIVDVEGNARALDMTGARWSPGATWTSPETGAEYPIEWSIELPNEQIALEVEALLAQQEVRAERTVGFAYWEGLSRYKVRFGAEAVEGEGYVELTGYNDD